MKEFFRKKLVWLKRNPQVISLFLIIIACMIYTFSLGLFALGTKAMYTASSLEALKQSGITVSGFYRNPAIYVFINTLISVLLCISFLSVYKKGKVNWFMFSVSMLMIAVLVACDIVYILSLNFYFDITAVDNLTASREASVTRTIVHLVAMIVVTISILTKPLYGKLLNKIDTSVEDEYDKLMDQKSEEDLLIDLEDET